MTSINLSKKFTPHMQTVTGNVDVIVTQLLRYHMPLLYCMQPLNCGMFYRLVMISTDLSEPAHFGYCQSKTKSETIFFPTKKFLRFFLRTEFCLGLHTAVVFLMQSFNSSCVILYIIVGCPTTFVLHSLS